MMEFPVGINATKAELDHFSISQNVTDMTYENYAVMQGNGL